MSNDASRLRRYVPLDYAFRFKRNKSTGLPFFLDNLGDDLLLVLLAFVPFSSDPIAFALAIFFFHVSFWTVYEIGYFENDAMSASFEHEARVTPGFHEAAAYYSERQAWIWAVALAIPGAMLVAWVKATESIALVALLYLLAWCALLGCLRGVYYAYNRIDKLSRVWLYLPLQILKYAFPLMFIHLPAAGASLVFAQCLRRWIPYIVYRYGGRGLVALPSKVLRVLSFLSIWLLLLPSNLSDSYVIHGVIILVWLCFRGLSQIRKVVRNAQHVQHDKWSSPGSTES
ncbi:hypothetical protein [Ruegeria sp. A3M17]|uniref:hypothetical protein n=1 Tax=Ruegeria sp. A3M17 TaxID=2267229 RepID=UPI000DE96831|nr:hypothetical protein [Ruegeria sp. A3M17]RBW54939.1 hypothetical protein DS906_15560 [Ruegeria sp. A3M17]